MSIADKFEVIADEVYEKGVSDGQIAFVDNYIDSKNGEFTNAFYRWENTYYKPTKNIQASVLASTYSYSTITDTLVDITFMGTSIGSVFYMANKLQTIKNLILTQDTSFANSIFGQCISLKNLTISGDGKIINSTTLQYSKSLSEKSIRSVVNALSPIVTGQTITFSKQAVNSAFEIDVDDETTWEEGSEYRKLIQTKPNWTFNHV